MAHVSGIAAAAQLHQPALRKIGPRDIADAVKKGIDDAMAKPTFMLLLMVIYPLVTLGAFLVVFNYDLLPLVFPVLSGFLLLGPFITVGLCEVSRRRELGMDVSGPTVFDFHRSPSFRDIMLLGLLLVGLFFFWLATAMTLYGLTLGDPWKSAPSGAAVGFFNQLFTTPGGWTLIILGNITGLFFAVAALCIGAISFPLLLDQPVGLAMAVQTSIRVVLVNPVMMAAWGLLVGVSMIAGALPFLVGLSVVIPVLGHATWHLYRKVIQP